MTNFAKLVLAGAAIGGLAAPAAAQYQYPYQQTNPQQYQQGYGYQQTYPQQYQQGYGYQQTYPQQYQGYGYQQGYNNPVGQIIDQLLGNRYNVTDRQAVSRCASAVITQARSQYGAYGNGHNNGYGNNGYNRGYANLRVTAITDVQRRTNGLRVRGTLGSGYGGYSGYGQSAYQNRGYAGRDLTFRCNVDYRGAVTGIRIGRGDGYRG
jgi:hypothetical protein